MTKFVLTDMETNADNSKEIVASTEEIGAGINQVNQIIQEMALNNESFIKDIDNKE